MTDKITTIWKGNMQFESTNPSGHNVLMDTAVEGVKKRFGLSPKAMMLSSLAGCSAIDVVMILEKMKITKYNFKIQVEGELTSEHPKYYHTVTVDYFFEGKNLDKAKCKRAVNLSIEKYCGVMEMFRKFSQVKTAIHFN